MRSTSAPRLTLAACAVLGCAGPGEVRAASGDLARGLFANGPQAVVTRTMTLPHLVLAAGQTLSAPPGKQLSLTVDGIDTGIEPGEYRGHVVLTVSDPHVVTYRTLPPAPFRTAVFIEDDRVVAAKSVLAAVSGGEAGSGSAHDLHIVSRANLLNGVLVTGHSHYTLEHPVIDFTGYGGNDFAGWGAALMSTGDADVTVNHAQIHTKGAVRTAIFVGGHSTMHVNDSDIYTESGALPPGYVETLDLGLMKEVPWQLSLGGNVRATNLVGNGTVYYTRSRIRSSGWGALSVDDAARVRMVAKDCLIETLDSGYGAYSIGDSIDTFDHTTMNVADYGLIMAGAGGGVFTNGSVVNSRRFGVMQFERDGGGELRIDGGSVFNTRLTAFLFKGRGGRIVLDGAQVNAGNGILLQAMVEDNPRMIERRLAAEKARREQDAAAIARTSGPIVGEQAVSTAASAGSPDVLATLRNVDLRGDLLNTRTAEGALVVKLEHASLHGAISSGTQRPVAGAGTVLTRANYWQIGEVLNTLGPVVAARAVEVSVDAASSWTVTHTSYLTSLTLATGAQLLAPAGRRLTLTVDGKPQAATAGHFQGALVLQVDSP